MANDTRTNKLFSKKSRKKKLLIWAFSIVLILVGSGVTYAAILMKKAENVINTKSYEPIKNQKPNSDKDSEDPSSNNISILFMGVDDSEKRNYHDVTRTDSLILATFNAEDKSIKMLSIPRDTYVYIPAVNRNDKINAAHVFGGVEGTIDTVQQLFGIRIDYYVKLNFNAFLDVIDALGGVEVNVPYHMVEQDSNDRKGAIVLEPGLQTLNAEQALAFARTRHYDNDFERGKRQQEIIKAILSKATSFSSITKYADLIDAIGSNMKTNMAFDEMKSLFGYVKTGTLNIESLSLKGYDDKIDGIYYFQLDKQSVADIQQTLKNHLGETHVVSTQNEVSTEASSSTDNSSN